MAAIEQMVEMLVITDCDGKILYCNPAFEKITGYSKSETVGKNPRFLQSGKHSAEFYRQLWSTIKQGGVWKGRLINRKKDATFYDQDSTISPIRDASGEISGFVALNLDVTEKLALERQYLEAQKLESVGRLAGHESMAQAFQELSVDHQYAKHSLRETEENLRELVSVMPASVYACDREGVITYFNPHAVEIWGRTPELDDSALVISGFAANVSHGRDSTRPRRRAGTASARDGRPAY